MKTVHLLELKSITDAMVAENIITVGEQIDFLEKAGLTKITKDHWIDTKGSKYSFA
jgi:hypothetical protein